MKPRSNAPWALFGPIALLSLALLGAPGDARTIFVNANAPGPAQDGAAWATAFRTVQAGVTAALPDDEVWVAAATYTENIALTSGVAVYGGFAGTEAVRDERNWRTHPTILDGGRAGSVVAAGASVTQEARVDGFTIRNGGRGGVYVGQGKVIVAHSVIRGNFSTVDAVGGGVYIDGVGTATVVSSSICGNGGGGGVYAGPYATVKLVNVTITGNTAYGGAGGGVQLDTHSNAELANCLLAGDSGGVSAVDSTVTVAVRNCDVYLFDGVAYSGMPDPTGTNGNISVDPWLSNAYNDPHIQPSSPCIDAGDTSAAIGATDIDGQPRVQGAAVDIGADESDGTTWPSTNRVWRVSQLGNDANGGTSWSDAKATVAAALTVAQGGDEVWVREGTYMGTLVVPVGVSLYGGFAGTEGDRARRDPLANPTVLDGDRQGCVVMIPFRSVVVDGFTIRNGSERGILISTGSAMIANNRICDNTSTHAGGGLYVGSYATITGNLITGNKSEADGGGMYVGLCHAEVTDNAISGNTASGNGGGVYATATDFTFTDNAVCGNRSFLSGGGLYLEWGTADRNVISGNRAEGNGGGAYLFSGALSNLTLTGNTASYGGGLYITSGPARGCTIVGNKAKNGGGAIATFFGAVTVANTIAAFNSSGIQRVTGTLTIRNCDVFGNAGGNFTGVADPTGTAGNITADPVFADRILGDLHLRDGSPCIDAGSNEAGIGTEDGGGRARVFGATVDMGALEAGAVPGTVWYVSPTGDDSNNGKSWATARRTVSGAVCGTTSGARSGDEIWVAAGTYTDNATLLSGVSVYGGFTGTETQREQRNPTANATVLDGGAHGSVVKTNCYGVVIDGFTIRNGRGGGVAVTAGSATIRNCRITSNAAAVGAGVLAGGSVTLLNSQVDFNKATEDGGGIYVAGSAAVADSNLATNTATGRSGGGVYVAGSAALLRDTVSGNAALNANGGGVYVARGAAAITDTLLFSNGAYSGSGISVNGLATISNCTIAANIQSGFGGGIYTDEYGDTTVSNTIIAYNNSGLYHKGGTLAVSHCDLFGNATYDYATYSGPPSPVGANGNISADPLFANRATGNFHLLSGSPCLDAGDDAVVFSGERDRDGGPRITGAHVDMGAYESGLGPITVEDAVQALRVAAGMAAASTADVVRLNVVPGAPPAPIVDMADAALLARLAEGANTQ